MSIVTPATVTAHWFSEQLQGAGHRNAKVASFTATQIGTGQIGKCIRYELVYEDSDGAPATLVGKFPSDNEDSRNTGVALRNYYLEVNFYRELAEQLPIRTPRCYYADIIEHGPEFALLLQDMSPAVQGDQILGCSTAVANAAIQELVGLQTPLWCDPKLLEMDWLAPTSAFPADGAFDLYGMTLPGFIERYGAKLADEQIAILEAVGRSPTCSLFQKHGDLFCLEHLDYRLDNMLIDSSGTKPTVTIVDWQSVKVGKPLNDVAYCLGAGLQPELRRESERDIVKEYHTALVASGISNLSWDDCWEAYRQGSLAGFAVTVVAAMLVQQTERGDQMFLTMADRHSRHALDLGIMEYLN
jgi:hypothetical protein